MKKQIYHCLSCYSFTGVKHMDREIGHDCKNGCSCICHNLMTKEKREMKKEKEMIKQEKQKKKLQKKMVRLHKRVRKVEAKRTILQEKINGYHAEILKIQKKLNKK